MWCPEGFITIEHIASRFYDEAIQLFDEEVNAVGGEYESLPEGGLAAALEKLEMEEGPDREWAYRQWMLSWFFRAYGDDIRACLPSGNLVKIPRSAFTWTYPRDDNFDDDLSRSGYEFPTDDALISRILERRFLYLDDYRLVLLGEQQETYLGEPVIAISPFREIAGAALCISEQIFASDSGISGLVMEALRERARKERSSDTSAMRNLPQAIVEAYKTGKVRRRTEAKSIFGRGLKTEAWISVWQDAVALDPDLSRPGPR